MHQSFRYAVPRTHALLFILLSVMLASGSRADAERTVVSVQSVSARPYNEALKGFESTLSNTDVNLLKIILSESREKDLPKILAARKPDLVLAIGMDALLKVAQQSHIPIIYVMVLNPPATLLPGKQVTGVQMGVSPENQLAILREALPQTRTIGLLYDPQRSGRLVRRIRMAAKQYDIAVLAREITRTEQVPGVLTQMTATIDIFWMLPDLTVVTPETVEFLLLFAMESGTPILTFSEKYAELGAILSIAADPRDMGRQAGVMAAKIFAGAHAGDIPPEDADKAMVTINLKTARKMGVTLGEEILHTARILE